MHNKQRSRHLRVVQILVRRADATGGGAQRDEE